MVSRELEIGFNWFYRLDPQTEQEFWTELKEKGGERFVAAVDWVGVDAYPGTFFPPGGPAPRRQPAERGVPARASA